MGQGSRDRWQVKNCFTQVPSGAKARLQRLLTARLKPCPFKLQKRALGRCWSFLYRWRYGLFGRGRGVGAYFLFRVTKFLDFLQALLFFVDADGEKLDDRLSDAQAALQFMNHGARAFDGHQNVETLAELAHHVR